MARLNQQEIERRDFESFARDYVLPEGIVEFSDKPDVLIRGSRLVGIELASLHKIDGGNPESEKIQGKRRSEVIEIAERCYRERGGRNIEIHVDFDPEHPINDVEKSAESLVSIVSRIANEADGHTSYCAFPESPEIRYLFHNGEEYVDAKWRLSQGFDVPSLLVDRVRSIVAIKSKKAVNYRKCDVYWLLLVVDFWDPSQDQYIDWPLGQRLGSTPFERVFLYKPVFKEIVEVPQ